MLIKEMPNEEKPRERLIKYGVKNISNEELISIILRTGVKNISVKNLAFQIITKINNINDLKTLSLNDLSNIKGLKEAKAVSLIAAIELGKRVYNNYDINNKMVISSTSIAYQTFSEILKDETQEKFLAIFLDTKKKLISYKVLFIGTVDFSLVHPREIFKEAYRLSASSIIVMHNHPSGEVDPSQDDLNVTNQLVSIGKIMGIPIIDHIIIGNNKYYSFLENNLMN